MNTDNKYKAFFEKSTPDYDPELLWDNIEPHLPQKEKRRPVFLLWLAGLAIGVVVYLFNTDPLSVSKNEIYAPSIPAVEALKPVVKIDTPSKFETKPKSTKSTQNYENLHSAKKTSLGKGLEKPISKNVEAIAKTNLDVDLRKADAKNILSINNEQLKSPVMNQLLEDSSIIYSQENLSDTQEVQVDNLNTQSSPSDAQVIDNRAVVDIKRLISNHPLQIEQTTNDGHAQSKAFSAPYLESANFKFSFFMTSTTFAGFTTSSINSFEMSSDKFVQFKKDHERPVENFGFNLLLGLKKNKFSITTGIQYDRITEIFTADDLTAFKYNIISDSALYLQNSNGTTYFSGNREVTRTTGKGITSPNIIQRWSMPIRLGYELGLTAKMKLNLTAGINLNFVNKYDGITVNQGLNFIYKDPKKLDQLYKNTGVHAWMGGVSILHSIGQQLWLGLGLEIQSDLTSQITNEWNTSQKYSLYRIRLSASYLVF